MSNNLNILVADDDLVSREIATRMLKKMGIRADVAANGLEAIHAMAKQTYDLVLMDIQMPIMDGIEASKIITKRWPLGPKIIVITDCVPNLYRELCLNAGACEFITKPVRMKELAMAILRYSPPNTEQAPESVFAGRAE